MTHRSQHVLAVHVPEPQHAAITNTPGGYTMPMFMDVHSMKGVKAEDVVKAHLADLKVQDKHGVKFVKYWVDEKAGKIFCLSQAPNKEAAIAVHREAHGLLADEIFEVKEGS